MDLSKLKSFIIVAEELNFRKSAEILGISQPPLTRLISSLEEELSTKLFERTTRQVQLTGAGVFLLKEGKEIIARAENLEKEVRSIGKLKAGKLNIGFSTTSFLANLPHIIDEFQNRFPKLKFQLHQETRNRILKGLRSGQFDVCFMEGTVSEEGLENHSVHDEGLGVLVPKKHPLAKRKEIELKELKDETIILHPKKEAGKFYDTISQLFKQNGIKPKVYVKNDRESCPILVATGKGVSLTILGAQNIVPSETQFVPIKKLYLPVSVFWEPENKNPLLKTFLSFVIESGSFKNKKAECLMDVMRL
ncbi:LysR family transcriptional regulator [Leptospira barantonii]|uniref:LysR family transcriptional regulator n=1 Tax=Leptospira barantonii TaxID=2023184 RepID=A0ABX4NK36_9LEPT|nr:LysR family transcriptional regulator [Leptospira barantonii]PJZ57182.1 LysR family transcriptional regulator [Leptospira barantonii]